MTTDRHTAVPHQPLAAPGEDGPRRPRPSTRRRLLTLLVVVLLIGIPAGYLVVSAEQSRDSGKDKQGKAAATGLTADWPSRLQRRIYDVPIPRYSTRVAFYETNSWKVSKLYVQFATSDEGLDTFLHNIGTNRAELRDDRISIGAKEAGTVGWRFGAGRHYAGIVHHQPEPQPDQDVVVSFSDPARPRVYVVSTATP